VRRQNIGRQNARTMDEAMTVVDVKRGEGA